MVTTFVSKFIDFIGALEPQFTKTQELVASLKIIPFGDCGNEVAIVVKISVSILILIIFFAVKSVTYKFPELSCVNPFKNVPPTFRLKTFTPSD